MEHSMTKENPIVFSGIQPSGDLHIGNYFGAISNWVNIQDQYNCVYCVVDLHSMTMPYVPDDLRQNSRQMFIDLLSSGIDPQKATLFLQSMVPEHTELNWILSCVASYGELTRQTQFKEKSAQLDSGKTDYFISSGLFSYPVLQAADILAYRAHFVPVGKDQEQHLELSRNIARRFNNQFGEYFPEPQVLSTKTPKVLSLADPTAKMSKSLGPKHYVGLFEEESSIRKKVRSAVTDSSDLPDGVHMSPGVESLFVILNAAGGSDAAATLTQDYEAGTLKYVNLKDAVADALITMIEPMRQKRAALMADPKGIDALIEEMAEKARQVARVTIAEVRQLVGLPQRK